MAGSCGHGHVLMLICDILLWFYLITLTTVYSDVKNNKYSTLFRNLLENVHLEDQDGHNGNIKTDLCEICFADRTRPGSCLGIREVVRSVFCHQRFTIAVV
jgi:hypothetical protein